MAAVPATLTWIPYKRPLVKRLETAYGAWRRREGCLLRFRPGDGAPDHFGEIAPLPELGTELQTEAVGWLTYHLGPPGRPAPLEAPLEAADAPPACRTGLAQIGPVSEPGVAGPPRQPGKRSGQPLRTAALIGSLSRPLAAREKSLRAAGRGFRTLKIKAGREDPVREGKSLAGLIEQTGAGIDWRMDANAAWSPDEALRFLNALGTTATSLACLEQPCAVGRETDMRGLQETAGIPVALDESVRTLEDLERWEDQGWPGWYVLKPMIAGVGPETLAQRLAPLCERVILSSSFETGIGADHALRLAEALTVEGAATLPELGWGTASWFPPEDGFGHPGIRADQPELRMAHDPRRLSQSIWDVAWRNCP
ncbi:MAG: o-succinylbenzoate synthase [Opitutales bacterium]